MIVFGDYHTHTEYSRHKHGKGTIDQNVSVAKQKGLREVAISEHGFNHKFFGIKRKNVNNYFAEIESASEKYAIPVLKGIEANIIGLDGTIDLTEEEASYFDVVLCGFHCFVKPKTVKDGYYLFTKNLLKKNPSKKQIERNTTAVCEALRKNKIDILTHINYGMKVDVYEVAKTAIATGTYIELNRKRILLSDEELLNLAKMGVNFIVSSDAHEPESVGENDYALNLIRRLNLPVLQVKNINQLPLFHKPRNK